MVVFFFEGYQPTLDVRTAQIGESWGFNHQATLLNVWLSG